MDCIKAQSVLDHADSDPDRVLESDWEALGIHLDSCAECDSRFRGNQDLDLTITDVLRDHIEIPFQGQQTILELLQNSDSGEELSESPATAANRRTSILSWSGWKSPSEWKSHLWKVSAATISAGLLIALVWSMSRPPVLLTLDTIYNQAPVQHSALEPLPEFDNHFDANLPRVGWGNVSLEAPIRGWQPNRGSGGLAAVYSFKVRQRGRIRAQGVLLVVPKSAIDPTPLESQFDPGNVTYTSRSGQPYAAITWTEGDLVYVCFVQNKAGALDALRTTLMGRAV